MGNVTKRQEDFLQNLMKGMSQRQAYIAAYPKAQGWKPENVDAQASNLLKIPKVRTRYEELQKDAQNANAISRDMLIGELKKIGFCPINYICIPEKDLLRMKVRALETMAKILGFDAPQDDED